LDTSHIGFVHARSLNPLPVHFATPRVSTQSTSLLISRDANNLDAHLFAFLFPSLTGNVNLRIISEFRCAGLIVAVSSRFSQASLDDAAGKEIARMAFIHAVTPATDTTVHYFPIVVRNFRLTDDALSAEIMTQNLQVAREDQAVVEAIEAAMQGEPVPANIALVQDNAAELARQLIARMIDAEAGGNGSR
jgi:vanillate O-demethylase monooxygenase subunit